MSTSFRTRTLGSASAALLLAGAALGQTDEPATTDEPAAPEAAVVADEPASPFVAVESDDYHSLLDVGRIVAQWIDAGAGRVRAIDVGTTRGRRPVPALEFGAANDELPLEARPTVFLIGGLDGTSLAGGEAVLQATHALLERLDDLRTDVSIVAIPWASPDGLARNLERGGQPGGNDQNTDLDADGSKGEDPPDDLDGDGFVLDMLIADPDGAWTPSSDPRFLIRARAGDTPRYSRTREGRDDDGDGRFNEDGPTGVRLDANYPVDWVRDDLSQESGSLPMSEPLARRLADLVLQRRTAAVLVFQGNHGQLALPDAVDASEGGDRFILQRIGDAFQKATGRAPKPLVTLSEARAEPAHGAFLSWLYAVPGVVAAEVSVWGPDAFGIAPAPVSPSDNPSATAERRPPSASDAAWGRWLDDVRGGIGFVEWHAIELKSGSSALVGGWEPRTHRNPPSVLLAAALQGVPAFVGDVVAALPRLELNVVRQERRGNVCHISMTVKNSGLVATGLSTTGRWRERSDGSVRVELDLPAGAKLVAGDLKTNVGTLAGRASSRRIEWVVLAPQGVALRVKATTGWAASATREVRP